MKGAFTLSKSPNGQRHWNGNQERIRFSWRGVFKLSDLQTNECFSVYKHESLLWCLIARYLRVIVVAAYFQKARTLRSYCSITLSRMITSLCLQLQILCRIWNLYRLIIVGQFSLFLFHICKRCKGTRAKGCNVTATYQAVKFPEFFRDTDFAGLNYDHFEAY